jgi:hypothetical protein
LVGRRGCVTAQCGFDRCHSGPRPVDAIPDWKYSVRSSLV